MVHKSIKVKENIVGFVSHETKSFQCSNQVTREKKGVSNI